MCFKIVSWPAMAGERVARATQGIYRHLYQPWWIKSTWVAFQTAALSGDWRSVSQSLKGWRKETIPSISVDALGSIYALGKFDKIDNEDSFLFLFVIGMVRGN
jgi:hypothetical protein